MTVSDAKTDGQEQKAPDRKHQLIELAILRTAVNALARRFDDIEPPGLGRARGEELEWQWLWIHVDNRFTDMYSDLSNLIERVAEDMLHMEHRGCEPPPGLPNPDCLVPLHRTVHDAVRRLGDLAPAVQTGVWETIQRPWMAASNAIEHAGFAIEALERAVRKELA